MVKAINRIEHLSVQKFNVTIELFSDRNLFRGGSSGRRKTGHPDKYSNTVKLMLN